MVRPGGLLAAALLGAAAVAAAVTDVAARAATPMTDEATLNALRTYLRSTLTRGEGTSGWREGVWRADWKTQTCPLVGV